MADLPRFYAEPRSAFARRFKEPGAFEAAYQQDFDWEILDRTKIADRRCIARAMRSDALRIAAALNEMVGTA